MNAVYHVFFPSLSLTRFYAQISYRLTKRTGKQVKQRFCSCLKVVAALSQARDQFKSLRSGLILFLHLGTVQGFSIIDKLVIRWELGLFLCLFPLPPSVPPPLSLASHPSYVSFFYTGQLRQNARELDVLENRTTFQSNTLIDFFFFPLLLLFSCFSLTVFFIFLFPRSLFVFMPKSLGRGGCERLQLQQWRPLWQNTEYVFNYLDFLMLLSSHRKYCSCSDVPIMFSFECLLSAGSPTPLPTPHHFQQPSSVHHF